MKLLVSDYDGTYKKTGILTKSFNNTLLDFINNGNLFALASGRNYSSLKKEIDKYNIPYNFLICNNGNTLFDNEGNLLFSKEIDSLYVSKALDILLASNTIKKICLNDIYGNITFDFNKICEIFCVINPLQIKKFDIIREKINFLSLYKILHLAIFTHYLDKTVAVEKIKELYDGKIDNKDIYAIGNSYNDVHMCEKYNGYKTLFSSEALKEIDAKTIASIPNLIKKLTRSK